MFSVSVGGVDISESGERDNICRDSSALAVHSEGTADGVVHSLLSSSSSRYCVYILSQMAMTFWTTSPVEHDA